MDDPATHADRRRATRPATGEPGAGRKAAKGAAWAGRRPGVREDEPILGSLAADFDFGQKPRPPMLLPTNPPTDSPDIGPNFAAKPLCLGCTALPLP